MRAKEFTEIEPLNEINMSPGNLQKLVQTISATAGMEFEMVVPGLAGDDSNLEPDYSADTRPSSIQHVIDFFESDYNDSRQLQRLESSLGEVYSDWLYEKMVAEFNDNDRDIIGEYIEDNALADSESEKNEMIDNAIERRDRIYDQAFENFQEQYMEDPPFTDGEWIRKEYRSMADIENNFNIQWPFWELAGGDVEISDIADNFEKSIGRPITYATSYHGAERKPGYYVLEPDSSIEANDNDGGSGLEFVSPPLPMNEMISDFLKVKQWAQENDCYTNRSTGLHINVSLENYDFGRLDYVKLAVLLGDQYVLKEFGRQYNTYTRSALGKIRERVKEYPARAQELLDAIKKGTASIASKIIHSGVTDKYTSINNKTGYIEFRSAGGDWLNADTDKIINIMYRYVVALDAACDPEKYKQEYLKKLYTILRPADTQDPIYFYNQYQAGQITKTELKNFINSMRAKRVSPPSGERRWNWDIRLGGTSAGISVVARTEQEAIQKAMSHWGLRPGEEDRLDVRAVGPYEDDV